ncbi:hypothetical protein [uncultured Desulfobulbus sp.]|uniref:hypothetical protein n=1 Tax=uncultured Desulfobulbus sp. TaxID=239745 RepID=UPI0029C6D8F8|nr:hypothetical protein [uncultured Desulfobulbus sp.]
MNINGTEPNLRSPEPPSTVPLTGTRIAWLSCIVIIFLTFAVMAAILYPAHQRVKARSMICLSNTKSLGMAFLMYMADSDDQMPSGNNWLWEVDPYIRSKAILKCPSVSTLDPCYAFNSKLEKTRNSDIKEPDNTVMQFESVPGMNQCGGKELLPLPPRHPQGHSIGFVDGHAGSVMPTDIDSLIWNISK